VDGPRDVLVPSPLGAQAVPLDGNPWLWMAGRERLWRAVWIRPERLLSQKGAPESEALAIRIGAFIPSNPFQRSSVNPSQDASLFCPRSSVSRLWHGRLHSTCLLPLAARGSRLALADCSTQQPGKAPRLAQGSGVPRIKWPLPPHQTIE